MSQVRRRRALRCTVLAASTAVLASFVVAPAAQADISTESAPTTGAEPTSTDVAPVDASPTDVPAPATSSEPAPTPVSPDPAGEPAAPTAASPGPGDLVPGDTVVGELVQAWPDPTAEEHAHEAAEEHRDETPLSWIEPTEGDAVRVPTESLPDVAVGSTVAVTLGDEVVDEASVEQGLEPALEVQSVTVVDAASPDPTTASAGTAPTNTVTAVLVLPAGAASDGMTMSSVLGTLNSAVSSFWDEQSNGTVRISAVQGAAGWIRSSQGCSNPYSLWDDVAAQIGWTGGAGKHLMLYVPSNASGCAYGLGTVGTSIGSGGRSYVQASALSVMAHELGHNFGLGHSSELQCNSSLESGTCQTRSYYDFYDVMGISWGQVGTLNTVQAARLGLLPAGEQVSLTPSSASTTVTLAPVSASSGVRSVTLTASNGIVYYLEYRQASGQDAWLGDSRNAYRLNSGVVLRRAATADGNTSLLLDGTPSASSGWSSDLQQSLPVGSSLPVAGDAFSVIVRSVSAAGAEVGVVPAAAMGPIAASTVPAGQALGAGGVLYSPNGTYRLTVQGDGNVVVYGPSDAVVWATGTAGTDARLVVQSDGNLVVYAAGGRVLWNSETGGVAGGRLVLQSDGNLVLYSDDDRAQWWPSKRPTVLLPGRQLVSGQLLASPSGSYNFVIQSDGNAVVYGPRGVSWSTRTGGSGARLVMQPDGNLVVYRGDGVPLWNTGTGSRAGARAVLQDDGNLVVYSSSNQPLWWIGR